MNGDISGEHSISLNSFMSANYTFSIIVSLARQFQLYFRFERYFIRIGVILYFHFFYPNFMINDASFT